MKYLIALGLLVAFHQHILWYVRRLQDGGDEPMGLAVLVAALGLTWAQRGELKAMTAAGWRAGLGLLLAYGLLAPLLPNLLGCALALACVASLAGLWRRPGLVTLLLLSLPVVASLQFYLGYPLRLLTAGGAELLLQSVGVPVGRHGVDLLVKGIPVGVDAPCSGVRMLWAGGVLVGFLATILRLRWRATALLGGAGLGAVLLANILRAALLAVPEAGFLPITKTTHELLGAFCFLAAAIGLTLLAQRLPTASIRRTRILRS